jgi:CubicO group peptidase (beta-lactamase class C family)
MFLAALPLVLSLGCATQRPSSDLGARLDALLTRYEAYGFSGTVLVAKDDGIVLHKGYGLADRERAIRNDTSTRFEFASLTKPFTAAAILQLEDQGALSTADLVSRHLGAFPPPKDSATIHHLATHTAGLVPDGAELDYGPDRERFITSVKNVPAESIPGERYRYTNAGYSALAAVVEKASGQTFEAYVREQLFKRAGLVIAHFRGEVADAKLARGYFGTPAKIEVSTPPPYQWGVRGSGGMIMTVDEMYRWHRALHGGRVLSQRQMEKMFYPWPEEGYGWHVMKDRDGRALISKGGGMPEYASQLLYFPDDRLVVIWASNNLQQRWRQALNRSVPATAFGSAVVLPPARLATSLAPYIGRYVAASGAVFEIAANDGYLYVRGEEKSLPTSLLFYATGANVFTGFDPSRVELTEMRFEVGSDGGVRTMTVGELSAKREAAR